MKTDNFIKHLNDTHDNKLAIGEYGEMIVKHIHEYIEHQKPCNLFIAGEYLKILNKRLNAEYSLSDFDEISKIPPSVKSIGKTTDKTSLT